DQPVNVIHFGERDSTIHGRLQKLSEEPPSPPLTPDIRERMGDAAAKAAPAAASIGEGTIRMLCAPTSRGSYFMEMNTRIQVEHPSTEMVTGVDLIKEQIKSANNEKLSLTQADVEFEGWAIECRINAENPFKDFMPSPGEIEMYLPPGGLG